MDVQHALESHPSINGMCDYVGISRSGYYQREKRHNHQSPRKLRKKFIQGEIKAIWIKSLCIYGVGKITQELRSKGYKIAERTVGKYMRELGIHAVYLTPWTTTTTQKTRWTPLPWGSGATAHEGLSLSKRSSSTACATSWRLLIKNSNITSKREKEVAATFHQKQFGSNPVWLWIYLEL